MSSVCLNSVQFSDLQFTAAVDQLPEIISNLFMGQHLVIFDPGVSDYQYLAANLDPAIRDQSQVLILEGNQDGIVQISQALQKWSGIDTIHIICHGVPGGLYLGSAQLTVENLESYSNYLENWFNLSGCEWPEILLYGCEVAKGCRGAGFVQRFSEITGANIAASTSLTGDSKQGGNWNLEFKTNIVQCSHILSLSAQANYPSLLSFPNPLYGSTRGQDTLAGQSDIYIINPDNGKSAQVGTLQFATQAIARDANTGFVYYTETAKAAFGGGNPAGFELAAWDPASNTNTIVGTLSGVDVPAGQFVKLAQAQNGKIYGMVTANANLYEIDQNTAAVTKLGVISGNGFPAGGGDMAFDPKNPDLLWISATTGGTDYFIYKVDISNLNSAILINNLMLPTTGAGSFGFGVNGNLYTNSKIGTSPRVYEVDPTTGNTISSFLTIDVETGENLQFSDFGVLPTQTPEADLEIIKIADRTSVAPGDTITYTITVTHNGPDDLCQFGLIDIAPPELGNVSFTVTEGLYNTSTNIWSGLDFTIGESITLLLSGVVSGTTPLGSNIVNYAEIPTDGLIEPNPNNNTTIETTLVRVNSAPSADNDSITIPMGSTATLDILANDNDPDGFLVPGTIDLDPSTPGQQTSVTVPGQGTFQVNTTTGLVTFTPVANFTGSVTIPYVVADNIGATTTANITINVGNTPPTANPDTVNTPANTPVPINVLANDQDPENNIDPNTIDLDPDTPGQQTTRTVPGQGTFTLDPKNPGVVLFTPEPGFSGMAMISYTVSDTGGATSDPAKITVNVAETPNQPPVAQNDQYSTPRNTPLTIPPGQGVLINDQDPDGDTLIVTTTTPIMTGNGGTVTLNPDGSFTYIPDPTFTGEDTFFYTVSDGKGGTSTAQVRINVGGLTNSPPNAEDKTTVLPSTDLFVGVPPLSATDPDGDPITSFTITPPPASQGTLFLDNVPITNPRNLTPEEASRLIFSRNPNFVGDVNFTYTATDSNGNTDPTPATVTISVLERNRPPVLENIRTPFVNNENQIGIPPLRATDPDGDPIEFFNITPPDSSQGTLFLDGNPITNPRSLTPAEAGRLVFRPNPNFTGEATFTFTATDNRGSTSLGVGTVTIPVVAVDDTMPGAQEDPLLNNNPPDSPNIFIPPTSTDGRPTLEPIAIPQLIATDDDGDEIIGFILSDLPDPSQGVLWLNGQPVTPGQPLTPEEAGQLIFIPNPEYTGAISFNYASVDEFGNVDPTPATVSFSVVGVASLFSDGCPFTIPDFGGAPSLDAGITLVYPDFNFTNNLILGSNQDETLIGETFLNNLILGGAGNDSVVGGEAADLLVGGLGSDVPVGPEGDRDQLLGNQGNDVIKGEEGDDSIYAGKGHDWVWGGKDNDLIFGDFGNDTLIGDDGNDQLFGGVHDLLKRDLTGRDLLLGLDGNDSLQGNEGEDTLSGGKGDDYVRGGKDDDLLFGEQGNDLMFGDRGNDILLGGTGDDTLIGQNGDPSDESAGDDTLVGQEGNDLILGERGDDWLFGDEGEDTIFGGKGNDVVRGGKGDDVIFGDLGSDSLAGDDGNDCLFGGVVDLERQFLDEGDLIHGNGGNDTINGYVGDDSLDGGDGDDYIRGGKDDDMAAGGAGNDLMFGDMGNDSLCGGDGDDTLIGNNGDSLNDDPGRDLLVGGAGNDLLLGDRGEDVLQGGEGDDTLFGGKDDDTLIGGPGNDVLFGNLGRDLLVGGAGSDVYVLGFGTDTDTILGFNLGEDSLALVDGLSPDQLELSGVNNGSLLRIVETGDVLARLVGVSSQQMNQISFLSWTSEGKFIPFSIPEMDMTIQPGINGVII